jgi:hypothetical protein
MLINAENLVTVFKCSGRAAPPKNILSFARWFHRKDVLLHQAYLSMALVYTDPRNIEQCYTAIVNKQQSY